MVYVEDLLREHGKSLGLDLIVSNVELKRKIPRPEIHRPGLSLAGFMKKFVPNRLLVFGNSEVLYLKELPTELQKERLEAILTEETPAVIVAGKYSVPKKIVHICREQQIPLFKTTLPTTEVLTKATSLLIDEFAPMTTCHGTFIEAFGLGVLIQGDSSIGKSEAALGLMEKGHRLISDDVVKLRLRKDSTIEGSGPELNKHMMEIRGIGIINVAHLYGAVCVRGSKSLDLIVKLEEWDDQAFYDRIGLDEKFIEMLGVNIPYHILPVKPGRDVVLLIETIVLNHRLKLMGYHSAREFNVKLLETISRKQKEKDREATTKTS
ncbi:MAG: HPr(Ser) kinase/phosphatase [Verrucomicrobia bacterium]|nr:HPr(Ser) kinase/phosphatase [Verrucomicrobiota bacterium]